MLAEETELVDGKQRLAVVEDRPLGKGDFAVWTGTVAEGDSPPAAAKVNIGKSRIVSVEDRDVVVALVGKDPQLRCQVGVEVDVPLRRAVDLEDAVRTAFAAAVPGEVVLLSPACASYDAFPNFEARGERFRQIVAELRAENG